MGILESLGLRRGAAGTAVKAKARLQGLRAAQQPNRYADAALTGGGYGTGGGGQLGDWAPGVGDADADQLRDLQNLRAYSRDLVRNSPIACGAVETQLAHIVGTGLTLQSRIDAEALGLSDEQASEWQRNTERWFALWAGSTYADAMGQLDFYELQNLIERSKVESGDCFPLLTTKKRDGWPFQLAVQVIEADRVSNPNGAQDTNKITQGVERGEDMAPVAVHIADRHPGRYATDQRPTKWTRVQFRGGSGRRLVLQHMRRLRPGQTRGVPELAPIIEPLKQMTRYSEAEIAAAVNSATLALFTKMDQEAFQDLFDDDAQQAIIDRAKQWDGKIQAGRAINLLPGEEIESAKMERPNPNFGPFMDQFLTYIGMALGIPHEVLTRKFNSSFSAARAALLDAWRGFRIRRDLLVSRVCQPVYEEWLADAVALGIISAPGFFADAATRAAWCGSSWAGDGPGAIDPEKEAKGADARMKAGLTTLPEEIVAYDGGDWSTKHREQVRVKKARKEGGLEQDMPGQAPAPSGAIQPKATPSAPEPEPDNTDDLED
jgi:lambda family phage portal protein